MDIKRPHAELTKLCVEVITLGTGSRGQPKERWRDNVILLSPANM